MKYTRTMDDTRTIEKLLEEVDCFNYFSPQIATDGEIGDEIKYRMNEVGKCVEELRKCLSVKSANRFK